MECGERLSPQKIEVLRRARSPKCVTAVVWHTVCCEIRNSAEGTSSPPRGHEAPPTALWEEPPPSVMKPLPLFFGRNPVGSTLHKREGTKEHT